MTILWAFVPPLVILGVLGALLLYMVWTLPARWQSRVPPLPECQCPMCMRARGAKVEAVYSSLPSFRRIPRGTETTEETPRGRRTS